jgi:D-serine deaminase-like pyridoxal phosphate-dependent protein
MTVLATVVSVPARDRAVVAVSIDTNAEDRNKHLK